MFVLLLGVRVRVNVCLCVFSNVLNVCVCIVVGRACERECVFVCVLF